ncbi:D-ribose pyranase [Rossellomorea marisflavi]|uniref:D-ribose pyranase n=1 Tax=Rossellomorea marisflavi TaxID=189381 RepID=UPI003D2ED04A
MKRNGILNSEIAKVLADLGHTDTVVIADAGLPVPPHVKKIDLALKGGVPSFLDVVDILMDEMVVERMTAASELEQNPHVHKELQQRFEQIEYMSHEELKHQLQSARAVIRTGEITPYANCILHAGVTF